MFATQFDSVKSGKIRSVSLCGAIAVALSTFLPLNASGQEADGDFAGDKTWTDKAGQKHDVKPASVLLKDSKFRAAYNKIATEGKTSSDAEEEAFENYSHSLVQALTWKENLTNLPSERRELKKQLIRLGKANAPDLHKRLNDLALQVCTAVAADKKYPRAVRINCTLMLGELDDREYNAGANQEAVPSAAATGALVDLIADEKQPLFIRLEAVNALLRHTQPAMPPALQTKAAEALLAIFKAPVPEDKTRDGQIWLRIRASGLLLVMIEHKLPVDQAALASSLATLLSDDKLPSWARAIYAGDLGHLDGKSLPAAENGPTIRALAALALTILQASPFLPEEEAEADEAADGGNKNDKKASDDKDGKKEDKKEETEPLSPGAQKLLSEEMMWQLARIRRALYGKDAPAPRQDAPDGTLGLYSAANDADKTIAQKVVEQLDKSVKALTEVPNASKKSTDALQTANDVLEEVLTNAPADEGQTDLADEGVKGNAKAAGKTPASNP